VDSTGTPFTGIVACHWFISLQDITDGTSSTYLVGEKCVDPVGY
jgi:hypothetical protein